MKLDKGTKVKIVGNSIASMMGLSTVTGTVFLPRKDGCAIQCNETGAIETFDYDDGTWKELGS